MKKKYAALSKNVGLFSISSFGQKLLAFLLVPLYTNYLSTSQFGTLDLVITTITLLVPIFTINISEAVLRFTLEEKSNKEYLSIGIIVTAKGCLLLAVGLLLLSLIPALSSQRQYFIWILVLYLANSIYSLYQNYLRAVDHIKTMAISSLINSASMLFLNILLIVKLQMGITGYLISMLAGMFFAIVYIEPRDRILQKFSVEVSRDKVVKAKLYHYCIPTIFTALAWWINSSMDHYFVTAMCGVAQNGIYAVSYKIPTILGAFQSIFVQAWTLSAISEFDSEDKDGFFGKTYEMYNSMMIFACSLIMFFNIFISKIIYAKDFFIAWEYVPLLLLSSLFSALSGYLGSIFSAAKDTITCAVSTIISALINIALNIVLIPHYGVTGASIATVIAYFTAWLIRMVVSRRYIKMKINLVRDGIAYVALFVQMLCAMNATHLYVVQFIMVGILIALYGKFYLQFGRKLLSKIKCE